MKKKELNNQAATPSCQIKTTIGGQALIEGLMMIGPDKKAMAVRKPDGSIYLEELPMTRWTGLANLLFIRGSVRLFRQLVTGTRALLRSAELLDEASEPVTPATPVAMAGTLAGAAEGAAVVETADQSAPAAKRKRRTFKEWREGIDQKIDHFLTHHSEVMLYLSAIGGILFSVVLFILLPNLLAGGVSQWVGIGDATDRASAILKNLIEGAIRIVIFVGYLVLASRMGEIQRVWMYHGAEHKTIACYEAQMPLTVDNVRQFSRFHPRCGTSFMFIVILVSIVVFSLVGWWNPWINLLIRFMLVPFVAGIAYEIIRLAGRFNNPVTRAVSVPGLWLQRLTTAEPNDSMLEVAIAAMEAVIPEESGRDKW
ncbi:MAG: DUF1385 domain-containing protein [Clostridia bacterium]|nr:DUF1385 domain-containing protein [Clostridia bacterium]